MEPIFLSKILTKQARNEADLLAKEGRLQFPQVSLLKLFRFFRGYSLKITGKDNDGKYVGEKLCITNNGQTDFGNNIRATDESSFGDPFLIDLNEQCKENINWEKDYYVGSGSSYDADGNIFSVRLYTPEYYS